MNEQISKGISGSAIAPDTAVADSTIVIPLRRPVVAHGEEIKELRLREPTADDIDRIGNPVLIGIYEDNPKVHFDNKVMTSMIANLASVPPSSVKKIHTKDWNNAAWALMGFFTPDM